ncbi:hypothetical protein KC354_g100 [Hortaea werneckii]|nr:hypothetical protein KC354_g100 [Hortaea werneckii]
MPGTLLPSMVPRKHSNPAWGGPPVAAPNDISFFTGKRASVPLSSGLCTFSRKTPKPRSRQPFEPSSCVTNSYKALVLRVVFLSNGCSWTLNPTAACILFSLVPFTNFRFSFWVWRSKRCKTTNVATGGGRE